MNKSPLRYAKRPIIYAFEMPGQPGLKIGFTEQVAKSGNDFDAVEMRVKQEVAAIKLPNKNYKIVYYTTAITDDGEIFGRDLDFNRTKPDGFVHRWLKKFNIRQITGEWYDTDVKILEEVINAIKRGCPESGNKSLRHNFKMRPEQARFVIEETAPYFRKYQPEHWSKDADIPRYLWNAKMRFGKTFTAYQLAKEMGWKRILVLTYKPGVEQEWKTDLMTHEDFVDWQFIEGLQPWEEARIDETKPVVWFASYYDVLGKNADGGIKERHKKMREIEWDCLFVDEYHFGAWRDAAKELGSAEPSEKQNTLSENMDDANEIEEIMPLKVRGYLYLSGTPFKAIANGEFNENQISNWTYADEQRAKLNWNGEGENPYRGLPQIVMLTYQMPEKLREVAMKGEFNEFDLNTFFKAHKDKDGEFRFDLEKDVQKFLNILHGSDLEIEIENKFDYHAPALPFEDARLLSTLRHTFWFLPNVPACKAMERMLNNDPFYKNRFKIIRAAGSDTAGGKNAKDPVVEEIGDGVSTATITLSCGKLTTGVTIPAWSGVLFLRDTDAFETYFQTAFRAQSPWVITDTDDPMLKNVMKPVCYVLDFAPSRALKLLANYSAAFDGINDTRRPEKRLEELVELLPVLCFDGAKMRPLKATEILDISTYGTASTMLAKRWQSDRLIDTTTVVLEKVMNNPEIMAALGKIEGFRNIKNDIERVISTEKALHKAKKARLEEGREATSEELKEEKEKKKEQQNFKKKLRDKLKHFITRIPVFMYLTDYREEALIDVIRNLEPELFTRVTGLTIREFDQMREVGVFNQNELNAAIAQFRRFEDASLEYAGGRSAHDGDEKIGLFDTTVTRSEADEIIEAEIG